MLKTLYIENIAVIEKTSIDFSNGLNVLTGETGAGKSIIIDAINAIMGQRTSKDIIRTGESSAFVSAQFEDVNGSVRAKLEELGFELEDDILILQRSLSLSGKNSVKINGRPATVSMLRELSKYLINIHGQHESYELFSADSHLGYIDSYGGCQSLIDEYKEQYRAYIILKRKLNEAQSDESERLREIDLLKFQLTELIEADVQVGEEEQLEAERQALMNYERIFSLLNKAKQSLGGDNGGEEAVDSAVNAMQHAAELNSEYEGLSESLTDIYYNLRDCAEIISDAIDNLESDPQRLEEIEERLDLLNRLTRKYNCPCDELPGLAEHCADPVVSGQAGIELEVVERSEVRDVVVAEVVADGGELVLELYEIVRVHGHDGFLVGHPLETVVAVELDGYLLAFVGALGGHDDDAVGASATVDGRGECILEDVDGLDLR